MHKVKGVLKGYFEEGVVGGTWDKKIVNSCWVPKEHLSVLSPLQSCHNLLTWNDKIKINVVKSYKKTLKPSYSGIIAR